MDGGTHRAMAGEMVAEAVAAASSFLDIAPICDSRRRRAATSAARELDMAAGPCVWPPQLGPLPGGGFRQP